MSSFRHEALLYDGPDGFLSSALPFIREGLDGEEPVMVAVESEKIAGLQHALGPAAGAVRFADMAQIGRNPGRIIPAWHEFLDAHRQPGRAVRGIGEPIWAGRDPEELVECQLHEALLNVAFADAPDFRLLCTYDTAELGTDVVHEARCSHPVIVAGEDAQASVEFRGVEDPLIPFEAPLPRPPAVADVVGFERGSLHEIRRLVATRGVRAGLDQRRADDLVLAVNELATNSVQYGGGHGILRMWKAGDVLLCEIRDRGRIDDPLVGRHRRAADQVGGWGMRLVHQVADLVQVRSGHNGTVVRLRMRCA